MPIHLWSTRLTVRVLLPLLFGLMFTSGFAADPDPADKDLKANDPAELAKIMKRLPPTPPGKALDTFQLQHGFKLELVAAEPMLHDPVAACFDEHGRLFVAEMHGYPFSEEARKQQPQPIGKKMAATIRRLTDTDGDGVFDESTIYARGISWATSVCCWNGGVFVMAPSNLYYFRDTDDDGVADEQRVIATGFPRTNVQGLANGLQWWIDGKIYGVAGTNGGTLTLPNGQKLGSLRGRDFRFDPLTNEFEFLTGGRQFGHSLSDWGERFVCSNSNHIQQVLYPQHIIERAKTTPIPSPIRSIAVEGPAAEVYRISPAEPWRIVRTARRAADPNFRKRVSKTELVPTGFFTSATGVTIYRGDAYPEEFRGNAFIGDVGGNLVHRKTLTRDGVAHAAQRADAGVEFLASTDTWFRPVNFVNGPDGCLYILDMYRETIEHPISIPEDIKSHLDLQSGDGRGRIYRLVPPNWTPPKRANLAEASTNELIDALGSDNGWTRDTATRLLLRNERSEAVPRLRAIVRGEGAEANAKPLTRLHAMSVLEAYDALDLKTLYMALRSDDQHLSAAAIEKLPRYGESIDGIGGLPILAAIIEPETTPEPHKLFTILSTLPRLPESYREDVWFAMLKRIGTDRDLQTLALVVLPKTLPPGGALADAAETPALRLSFLSRLATVLTARGDDEAARTLMRTVLSDRFPQDLQNRALLGIAEGLRSRRRTIEQVVADDAPLREQVTQLHSRLANTIGANGVIASRQKEAIRLLPHIPWSVAEPEFRQMLHPTVPLPLQSAALDALTEHRSPEVPTLLLSLWSELSPSLKRQGIEALLVQPNRTKMLLDAIEQKTVANSDLAADQWTRLTGHPDAKLRTAAKLLYGAATDADRQRVVTRYAKSPGDAGDVALGKAVYTKQCATCHRANGEGYAVGPDLKSVANKSRDDLLIAILDPNREAQPNYIGYTIVLDDGLVKTGLIARETSDSITLRSAGGKEETIARERIEILKSNRTSLMPTGMEKNISADDMTHLIEFIQRGTK